MAINYKLLLSCLALLPLSVFAKELVNIDLPPSSFALEDLQVRTVSIFFSGTASLDVASIAKEAIKGRAETIITGGPSIIGDALSSDLDIAVTVPQSNNIKSKTPVLIFNKTTMGKPSLAISETARMIPAACSLGGKTVVFSKASPKEVSDIIRAYLDETITEILSIPGHKPKVFVIKPPEESR